MLDVLYRFVASYATWPAAALLVVVCMVLIASLHFLFRTLVRRRVLDLRLWYSAEEARQFFDAIGVRGRRAYVGLALTLDILYPIAYGTLMAMLMVLLFDQRWGRMLVLLPLLTVVADVLENLTVAHLAWWYNGKPSALTPLAATFTLVKWLLVGLAIAILVLGAVMRIAFA